MALIALAALEFGALRLAGPHGVNACNLLTVATLIWATTMARARKGGASDFYFGFALAGWAAYLLVIDALGNRSTDSIVGWIPLQLVEITYDRAAVQNTPGLRDRAIEQWRIAHYMMVLPVACLGGLVGWVLGRRRQPLNEEVGIAHPTEE
jgi:hypothetical protein